VHDRFQEREWKKAIKARSTDDCRAGKCHGCGLERMIPEDSKVCNSYPDLVTRAPQPAVETLAPTEVAVVARVRYTRGPEMRWSGHLDLVRLWERILRRAGIPVSYSQGFHPHAKLGFGPPLPVGLQSDAEYIDISIAEAMTADQVITEINSIVPEGLFADQAVVLEKRPEALASIVDRLVYAFPTPDSKQFDDSLKEFMLQDTCIVKRISKGKEKRVDLRQFVNQIDQHDGTTVLHLDAINGATARLDELASVWSAGPAFLSTITRKEMLVPSTDGSLVTPMEMMTDTLSRSGVMA